jgi:small conductance mechanosensitive channel
MNLRTTTIRAFDGIQHIVPNGGIQIVGNRSRGWARAIVDVKLAYRQDLEQARASLDELFEELGNDPEMGPWFQQRPRVLGVEDVQDGQVVVRVAAEVQPNHRVDTERELRGRIKVWLDSKGIATPGMPEPVSPEDAEG